VIGQLRAAGVASQADIARQTGLSRATVSSIVAELRTEGLLTEAKPAPASQPGGGRPPVLLRLHDSAGFVVGVDMGHTHVRSVVATLAHEVLAERELVLAVDHEAGRALDAAAGQVADVLRQAGIDRRRVVGVGLGLPGPVDRGRGIVGSSSILPGWGGVRAADELEARLGLPVEIDHDANLGALAEAQWGAARGCSEVAYIKISTGIGAGFILHGRPYRGATGTAGEIGHTSVDPAGRFCYCGNRGCLETVAAGPVVVEALRRGNQELTLAEILVEAAEGDNASRRAIAEAGRHVGVAVASVCNLLNPERVVVGGQMAEAGDLLLEPLRESISRYAVQAAAETVQVVPAAFGARAEVMGALALALLESERPLAHALDASSQGEARD
jgi:predicted NBD/HSP70 family sugar kinase